MNSTLAPQYKLGATMLYMGRVRWKLRSYLQEHSISAYQLVKELDSISRAPTIYKLAKEDVEIQRIDLGVMAAIIEGLESLTGKRVTPNDLLEYQN